MSRTNSVVLHLWLTSLIAIASKQIAAMQETANSTAESSEFKNPYSEPMDVENGRLYVRGYCSTCHGIDATGGRAPDLTRPRLRHGSTDKALFRNIQNGIPGTGMAGVRWPDKRVWQVVSFIRTQRSVPKPTALPGDARGGERIFDKQKCAVCHWTGNTGGRRGPDLTTSRGTPDYTRAAIMDPNKDVDRKYQQIVIVIDDGRVLHGMRLNENGYYIQFIDDNEKLYTISKANIEQVHKPDQSLMPSYANVLTDKELDDLIAYLFSLRPK